VYNDGGAAGSPCGDGWLDLKYVAVVMFSPEMSYLSQVSNHSVYRIEHGKSQLKAHCLFPTVADVQIGDWRIAVARKQLRTTTVCMCVCVWISVQR